MRRCKDGWVNASAILTAAGASKWQRDSECKGKGKAVIGGRDESTGCWFPPAEGLELARKYGFEAEIQQLLSLDIGHKGAAADILPSTRLYEPISRADQAGSPEPQTGPTSGRFSKRQGTGSKRKRTEGNEDDDENSAPQTSPTSGRFSKRRRSQRTGSKRNRTEENEDESHQSVLDNDENLNVRLFDEARAHEDRGQAELDVGENWIEGSQLARDYGVEDELRQLLSPSIGHGDAAADSLPSIEGGEVGVDDCQRDEVAQFRHPRRSPTGKRKSSSEVGIKNKRQKGQMASDEEVSRSKLMPVLQPRTRYSLRTRTNGTPKAPVQTAEDEDGRQAEDIIEQSYLEYCDDSRDVESEDDYLTQTMDSDNFNLPIPSSSPSPSSINSPQTPEAYLINQLMDSGIHGYANIKRILRSGGHKYVEIPKNIYSKLAEEILYRDNSVENTQCSCKEDCLSNCPNVHMLYECDETNCSRDYCSNRRFSDLENLGNQHRIEPFDSGDRGTGLRTKSGISFEEGTIVAKYPGFVVTEDELIQEIKCTYKDMDVSIPKFRTRTLAYSYIVFLCLRASYRSKISQEAIH